jgi:carbonic anhydrase
MLLNYSNALPLSGLLPSNRRYYPYQGSLTAPNCNQVVRWIVMEDAMPISSPQLAMLRNTTLQTSSTGVSVSYNYRPVQNLDQRLISRGGLSNSDSSASNVVVSLALLATVAMLAIL